MLIICTHRLHVTHTSPGPRGGAFMYSSFPTQKEM